jgi:hypothetical protein
MGHRANFVIIRGGAATAYYDQWGALGCTFFLAEGPAGAAAPVEAMEPTEELLEWAFAEAGYLLDYDLQRLIAFGYPEDPGDLDLEEMEDLGLGDPSEEIKALGALSAALQQGPGEFLTCIAPQWPGWLLQWDDRGVDAFAEHLRSRGLAEIRLQPDSHPEGRTRVEVQA